VYYRDIRTTGLLILPITTADLNHAATLIIPAKAREYVFTGVGLCVCVCVWDHDITKKIVDGFVPNVIARFLREREDQVRVSLRSAEGCGSNGQKLRKPAIV